MRLSRQFQAYLFIFLRKGFEHKKNTHQKVNQQNKIKQTLNNKDNIFLSAQKREICLFCVLVLFYVQDLFVKEK